MSATGRVLNEKRRQLILMIEEGLRLEDIASEWDQHYDSVRRLARRMRHAYQCEHLDDLPARVRQVEGDYWVDNPAPDA
jgi:transposase